MPRLGLTLAREGLDAPLSGHFGRAPWLAVLEDGAPARFLRNEGLSGARVAGAFAAAGVTDVVADHMGGGAWHHLAQHCLRVWQAAPGQGASAQAAAFAAGKLAPMVAPEGGHGHGGECGCGGH